MACLSSVDPRTAGAGDPAHGRRVRDLALPDRRGRRGHAALLHHRSAHLPRGVDPACFPDLRDRLCSLEEAAEGDAQRYSIARSSIAAAVVARAENTKEAGEMKRSN